MVGGGLLTQLLRREKCKVKTKHN